MKTNRDIISDAIDRIETSVAELTQMVIAMPVLNIVSTNSEDLPSKTYMNNKVKECEKFGVTAKIHEVTPDNIFEKIEELAKDLNNKIIIQLPMGEDYPPLADLLKLINPLQDVDGFSITMQELSVMREPNEIITHPCYSPTAKGVLLLNMLVDPEIKGKQVAIIGKGLTSGLPIANMYNCLGATVHTINSKSTLDAKYHAMCESEIIVSCAGVDVTNLILEEDYSDAICINVGMRRENDKLVGDLDYDSICNYAKFINPVLGSTGKLTTLFLIYNCLASQMTHEVIAYNNER